MCRGVRAHIGQQHRFAHTVRVARFADSLAQAHQQNAERARVAGMLHDLARLYPPRALLLESQARGLIITEFERRYPVVLHAPLGAELARELFSVNDEAVLSAIRKHTVAAASMSMLDCIVYLADGLEPGRDFPERSALAELAFRDLRSAMRLTIVSSLRYLAARSLTPAPQTLAAAEAFGVSVRDQEVIAAGTA